jgi:hypothetical protein
VHASDGFVYFRAPFKIFHGLHNIVQRKFFIIGQSNKFIVFERIDVGKAFPASGRYAPQTLALFDGLAFRKINHHRKEPLVIGNGGDILDGINDAFTIEKAKRQFFRQLIEAQKRGVFRAVDVDFESYFADDVFRAIE